MPFCLPSRYLGFGFRETAVPDLSYVRRAVEERSLLPDDFRPRSNRLGIACARHDLHVLRRHYRNWRGAPGVENAFARASRSGPPTY